jgi:hypothetical protein
MYQGLVLIASFSNASLQTVLAVNSLPHVCVVCLPEQPSAVHLLDYAGLGLPNPIAKGNGRWKLPFISHAGSAAHLPTAAISATLSIHQKQALTDPCTSRS